MEMPTLKARMTEFAYMQTGEIVLRRDFNGLASQSQITRALKQITAEGALYRLGQGVYAKTCPSVLSGKMRPRKVLAELAKEALRRFGIEPALGYAAREYAEGRSTQIPAWTTFDTGPRRITRKITVGISTLRYENDFCRRKTWDKKKGKFT
jgi:hypothetical protein